MIIRELGKTHGITLKRRLVTTVSITGCSREEKYMQHPNPWYGPGVIPNPL